MTERLHRTKPARSARVVRLNRGLSFLACAAGLLGVTQACGSSDNNPPAGQAGTSNVAGAGNTANNAGSPPIGSGGKPATAGAGNSGGSGNNGNAAGAPPGGGAPPTGGGAGPTAGAAGNAPTAGAGGSPPVNTSDNVLERNNNASRDGLFIQPKFTKAAAATMTADATFNTGAKFTGNMWASPLYLAPKAAGGKGLFFAVTTGNDVIAIDETSGATVWTKSIGTPAQANGVSCGNIHPLGILSTPVIDAASRTIYVAGAVGNASTIQKHVITAYNADDGMEKAGWPVDTTGLTSGSVTFNAPPQNQRSALSLVGGKLYVGYGGHIGDCGAYHGWIVAVDTADPTKKAGWATLGQGEAIWAAGGFASDGTNIFPVTGNRTGTAADSRSNTDSEAVVRLSGMASFTRNDQNIYFPTSWKDMDRTDADLGGSNSVLLSIAGATPANYVAAVAKDGNMYLLNPTNLGGMAGHVLTFKVSSGGAMAVKTSPTAYKTAKGTHYVFSTDSGAVCPGGGGGKSIVSVLLKAGTDGKPTATSEWCAPLTGAVTAPVSTTTDGTANPLVWFVDGGKLTAVDGEDGSKVFASTDSCSGVRQWTSPIATKGRVVVGGDTHLCSWSIK